MIYNAREIQIRLPWCPTHYTNMQRAIDILKNPAFWMFLSAVVLIHAFMNPLNLASWGGFIRVVFMRKHRGGQLCRVSCVCVIFTYSVHTCAQNCGVLSISLDFSNCCIGLCFGDLVGTDVRDL